MKSKHLFYSLLATIVLLSALLSSCSKEQVCFIPTNISGKILFSIKDARDTIIRTDTSVIDTTIITFRDSAMTNPSLQTYSYDTNFIFQSARGERIIQFALDPKQSQISYILMPDKTLSDEADTLTIYYQSKLYFISNDCGFTYSYLIDSAQITNNIIDSIAITQKEVTTEGNKQHLRLFFFN